MSLPLKKYRALAQEQLNRQGAALKVDGIWGPKSIAAAEKHLASVLPGPRLVALSVQRGWNTWAIANGADAIKADGWWGPDTQQAADALIERRDGKIPFERPDEPVAGKPGAAQCHDGSCSAVRCWTPTDAQMLAAYGSIGSQQILLPLPYPMVLDWDLGTTIKRISIHRKVADSARAALEEILAHYGPERVRQLGLDRFAGCLNVRKKRGGTTWSTHAWGTALDFWAAKNGLRQNHRQAAFARAEYAEWFAIWEKHGWMSLGRCYDFDWMHIQRNP